jgi:anti-sigma factor RsiW
MMHCTMDDLLALQANEGSAWAKQHLEACPACRAELEALYQRIAQLKALPARRPARDRWPAVREAIRVRGRNRRRRWGLWSLAVAAGVAALIVFRPFWSGQVDPAALAQVKQQSATLEAALERYGPDGRVMSGWSAALAAALEDTIAVIDGELVRLGGTATEAGPAELVKLWQQRVDLMQQLVSVRVTRASYVGL